MPFVNTDEGQTKSANRATASFFDITSDPLVDCGEGLALTGAGVGLALVGAEVLVGVMLTVGVD